VTHRDLKPDNILFSSDFDIKIADFGFAAPLDGKDGSGLQRTYLGTSYYKAPEINEK
jgi:serine/threonine protein kinase